MTVCEEFKHFGITCSPDETSKPAWAIYRVLETPEQKNARRWTRSIVSAKYLPSI